VLDGPPPSPSPASGASTEPSGRSVADVLALPDDLRQLFNWARRQGEVSLPDVVAHLGYTEETATALLVALVEQKFLQQVEGADGARYHSRLSARPSRPAARNIWQRLENA
jgi:hypothetical protein